MGRNDIHYKKHRSKIDNNQNEIVDALCKIPGVTVAVNHDDIIVGNLGVNYWYEIKQEDIYKKDGELKKGVLKDSQIKLLAEWEGHYRVVWTLDMILKEIGIKLDIKGTTA